MVATATLLPLLFTLIVCLLGSLFTPCSQQAERKEKGDKLPPVHKRKEGILLRVLLRQRGDCPRMMAGSRSWIGGREGSGCVYACVPWCV